MLLNALTTVLIEGHCKKNGWVL